MVQDTAGTLERKSSGGILFIVLAMMAISVNDVLIKLLSGDYPLHQMVFIRSMIGICFSLVMVQVEGGLSILRTRRPFLHALRCLLIVVANLTYFTALAAVSLAEATALFYIAPLMITLLSIPFLGEKVGPFRLGAVTVGFLGALIMLEPWKDSDERTVSLLVLILPLVAASAYAVNQILTRKLGAFSKASAMAVYIQFTFILVSLAFFAVAGGGGFASASENPSVQFLLRAWVWPDGNDIYFFLLLGANSAIVGYGMSQAYRLTDAATVAPFEYTGLPLAILWGWFVWGDLPGSSVWIGIVLIMGSGLFVFLRERQRKRAPASAARVPRRY